MLAFFKAQGKGCQTRINAVLRAYMEAQEGRQPAASVSTVRLPLV
ncbi:BrnA antitoxin family protein [Histidinibacterium lentulum]